MWRLHVDSTSVYFRVAIVVAMMTAVATVLWFTPLPKIEFASCERPCHALMWPMICRVTLTVEQYQSMSRACGDCPANASHCLRPQCVSADGRARGLLTVDRQLPGPTINVCENDILLVDVVNRLPGMELTLHWRGQPQRETPVMDGVPMITQCPIPSRTVFQYKFRASRAGTHLYHAFTGSPATESVFGALVVRQADSVDPHAGRYDEDRHLVLVSEWRHQAGPGSGPGPGPDPALPPGPGALLLNGRAAAQVAAAAAAAAAGGATTTPPAELLLRPGRRHRLRLAAAGGGADCAVRLWAERHSLTLIELDGAAVEPREVAALVLSPGERADVVLRADQRPGVYWLRAATAEGCAAPALRGGALLRYEGAPPGPPPPTAGPAPADNELDAPSPAASAVGAAGPPVFESRCGAGAAAGGPGRLCPLELRAVQPPPPELAEPRMRIALALPFGYKRVPAGNASAAGLVVGQRDSYLTVPHVNNLTFAFPSSPVLTQPADVDQELFCSEASLPYSCASAPAGGFCACLHTVNLPLGATVDLLLAHLGGEDHPAPGGQPESAEAEEDAVLHAHGYAPLVVGAARLPPGRPSAAQLLELDRRGRLLERRLPRPLARDTLTLPPRSLVALRFRADNPGYWLLHEQRPARWAAGLAVLLQVGTAADARPPPADFPRCGSFVGPHFFLI